MAGDGPHRRVGDEISTGEVVRAMELMRSDFRQALTDLRGDMHEALQAIQMQYANFVLMARYTPEQDAQDARLQKLEDRNEWAVRVIGAALILAVLAVIGFSTSGRLHP